MADRIYYAYLEPQGASAESAAMQGAEQWENVCAHAHSLGFDCLLIPPLWPGAPRRDGTAPDDPDRADARWLGTDSMVEALAAASRICARHQLRLFMDLVLDRVVAHGALARAHPDWYQDPGGMALDPRRDARAGLALAQREGRVPAEFLDAWSTRLMQWSRAGAAGFRCRAPARIDARDWRELIANVHAAQPDCRFMAWTPGLAPDQLASLAGAQFDASFSSVAWWDRRQPWLVEEHERLRRLAPAIAPVRDPDIAPADRDVMWDEGREQALQKLWTAALAGDGLLVPMGFEESVGAQAVADVNRWVSRKSKPGRRLLPLSGSMATVTALFRDDPEPTLLLINSDEQNAAPINWQSVRFGLPNGYVPVHPDDGLPAMLRPGESGLFNVAVATAAVDAGQPADDRRTNVARAMRAGRIAIENVSPAVDDGRFAVKRTLGESLQVQADVFIDGHDSISVCLAWRAADEAVWRLEPMWPEGNDRWMARFEPVRLGPHYYAIEAWRDDWQSYCAALRKNADAGRDVALDVEEGCRLLRAALKRAPRHAPAHADAIVRALDELGGLRPRSLAASRAKTQKGENGQKAQMAVKTQKAVETQNIASVCESQLDILLADDLAHAMARAGARPFHVRSDREYPLMVERREARFASWYELFPRSQSATPGVHGTFRDVVDRLPAISAMGFDVLYLPPIHPIGLSNRKGRNNTLQAGEDDPGSPYAIGSAHGGHDAVHPKLGSLADFRQLIGAARDQGMEIAMDFAIQCSPDHPWLREHPEWFAWRADGSLRYAENPPKRYEDIVNPDFHGTARASSKQSGLWLALRDVVLFWAEQGVRTFRVDNPHTKPFPFWQWLIRQVQDRYPDALFLSEAFTRPKLMYRLAKLGFTQSYTYFTWRNGKHELIAYLTELDSAPVADFFRPNFFVNTPDINPYYLQGGGRAAFLVRAALAATTSGLWGMYSGFELCEAEGLPGREEYSDSEKYQLRHRDWSRPGNIVAEIGLLNRIRHMNQALQSHRGIQFHAVDNDYILFFSKSTPRQDNVVIVAINLDPHAAQSGTLELPLWLWGLPDDAAVQMRDLFGGADFVLRGKYHHIVLSPERPFIIWSPSCLN